VRFYQTGYTVDGGLHVDGWTFNGRRRAAAPTVSETVPAKGKQHH
jgi:hypothetical protein